MSEALDWLVGIELPRVFEKYFRLPATVPLKTDADAVTPYVAFAVAVCKEQDIEMTASEAGEIGRRCGLREDAAL